MLIVSTVRKATVVRVLNSQLPVPPYTSGKSPASPAHRAQGLCFSPVVTFGAFFVKIMTYLSEIMVRKYQRIVWLKSFWNCKRKELPISTW